MKSIKIQLNKAKNQSYSIFIERDFSKPILNFLQKEFRGSTCVIITDETVEELYGKKLYALLKKSGRKVFIFSIPDGERSKNQKIKTMLEEKMLKLHIDRQAVIIALGGGVVGDLAGFIAATYMRGIPYIQVPTTLLAMVDSSIGGKTGIDTPQGKNLIGAFWQPRAIFINLKCIDSLSQKQFKNGLMEAIKMFITSDLKSFNYVEKNINSLLDRKEKVIKMVVKNAIKIKTGVVSRDEREEGERMILNFGHTIGHSLEKLSKYKMLHGYAVALGVMVESRLSVDAGKLLESDYARIKKIIIDKIGIDLKEFDAYKAEEILNHTKNDKKTKNGKSQYVLLKKIGEVNSNKNIFAHHITDTAVVRVLRKIKLAGSI